MARRFNGLSPRQWRAAGVSLTLGALCAPALAQQTAPPATDTNSEANNQLQEVVVTGTSIRGVSAPVGASLQTVNQQDIAETGAQTMQQVLANVPAVTGFGASGQGSFGSADASGTYAPTIHGLGASASNGTLVLVDGHRIPLSGANHALGDPNIIAPLMVDQIQVLPDGASSTYGSDAVAGVINIITRKSFNGFEATAQQGLAAGYHTNDLGALWGTDIDGTSVIASFNYEKRSSLINADRAFTNPNHTAQGGGNFDSFECDPASVEVAGKFYTSPYTGAGLASSAANCNYNAYADLLPEESRSSVMVKLSHEVNDRLNIEGNLVYSDEQTWSAATSGGVIATAYGPGSSPPGGAGQINPYFQGPPGVTSETVEWDGDNVIGLAADSGGAKTIMGNLDLEYTIASDWVASLVTTIGQNQSTIVDTGGLCSSCAYQAINGTATGGGNPATPAIPGTSITANTLPLTTSNALNVWSPTAAGTSAAVLANLGNSTTFQTTNNALKDVKLTINGTAVQLPGGPLKLAVGGEFTDYSILEQVTRPNNTGPATVGSQGFSLGWGRSVGSGFAELLIPVIGNGNSMPLVHSLEFDVSGRYDDYSDFGSTKNPRFALNWNPIQTLTVRADYARSFTAPALTSIGDHGVTAESGVTGTGVVSNLAVPNTFPGAIGLPGCTAATPTCTIGTPAVTGIQVNGPNANLKPEIGTTWSTGIDWAPLGVPGLRLSATLWNINYTGMITSPLATFAVTSPALAPLLTLYPGGATPAQIAALEGGRPITGALPTNVYYIYNYEQQNALNLQAQGIDGDFSYIHGTPIGTFSADLSESWKLKMMQQFGTGGAWFSILNTSGFNTTFPSNELAARLDLGYAPSPAFNVHLITNYEGAYYNWNGSAPFPLARNAQFIPIGGGQPIPSFTTFDLYASYTFAKDGVMKGTQVSLQVTDIGNSMPPFYNSSAGYDSYNGNPIGRMELLTLTKKW